MVFATPSSSSHSQVRFCLLSLLSRPYDVLRRVDEKASIEFVGWGGLDSQQQVVVDAAESNDVQEGEDSSSPALPLEEGQEDDNTPQEEAQRAEEESRE